MRNTIVFCLAALILASAAGAGTITLTSGNAPIGQPDPNVTVVGQAFTLDGAAYPAADVNRQQALAVNPNHNWAALEGSQWVGIADGEWGTCPDGGYLYSTSFVLPSDFSNPQLSLTMSSDNLSDIWLNGNRLGSVLTSNGQFLSLYTFQTATQSFFVSGKNDLEFRVVNTPLAAGVPNPSGLIFAATVTYVPEPASVVSVLLGACAMGGLVLRTRTRA